MSDESTDLFSRIGVPSPRGGDADGPVGAPASSSRAGGRRRAPDPNAPAGTPDRLRTLQGERGLQADSLELWAASPERAWFHEGRRSRLPAIGLALLILAVAISAAVPLTEDQRQVWADAQRAVVVVLGLTGSALLLWYAVPYLSARRAFADRRKAMAAYRVDIALDAVCHPSSGKPLGLAGLFELNRRQLDEYQEMTKRQQRIAFGLTWGASVVAFGVLVGGTALSLRQTPGSAQYVVGGLTGLGTLLSGFLSKTFYDGHREAMEQLNFYYAEPSMTGRVLAAERIIKKLGMRKGPGPGAGDVAREIVTGLLTWQSLAPARAPSSAEKSPPTDGAASGHAEDAAAEP